MRKSFSIITFVVLTALLVGGFPNFMTQEVHAALDGMTFTNIADNNKISADATVTYNLISSDSTPATAGTITFVRTGGTGDPGTHTYTMTGGNGDFTSSVGGGTAHAKTIIQLESDGGFATLVSGTIYTVTVDVTGTATFSVTKTGVTYDVTRPTMVSASTTSSTTIDVNFSEDILDAESADFTLSDGLTVASIVEAGGLVTITTNESFSEDVTPTVTLGYDFVTDLIDVGTVNTAVVHTITSIDGAPPTFVSAETISNTQIEITMSEYIVATGGSVTDWIVSGITAGVGTVSGQSISNPVITITTITVMQVGDLLFLNYTQPGSGLEDTGTLNEVVDFGPVPVTNNITGKPDKPTNLLVDSVGDGSVTLSWIEPNNNGGQPIVDYIIKYKVVGEGWHTFSDGVSTNTTSTVTDLDNGIAYKFKIKASNGAFTSYSSNVVNTVPNIS